MRRIPGFRGSLARFQDVVGLAVFAAVVGPLLSAALGASSLMLGGVVARDQLLRTWITWWTGDLVSVLLVAPALLTWAQRSPPPLRRGQRVEAAALVLVLVLCSALIFGQPMDVQTRSPLLNSYLLFLPLIWAALRFGVRGAATGTLLVSGFAVWGTSTGHGVLVRADLTHSLITLHVFPVAASLSTLALGAVISEREHSRLLLDKSESVLRSVIHGTMDASRSCVTSSSSTAARWSPRAPARTSAPPSR